ncbi:LON peptidase substrate-binding domain-containing protein [Inquilinus sp.]|jgi:Lon protease-like protein|uniref:LON peptidase substrate-binding domain-containing protein n=1 Tax=Inquilinus sp. TaxID=1932117 RepID=UPI0037830C77
MRGRPRAPAFQDLGTDLPVFPLPGVLLLPRGLLPLNIFEPRYLAMVEDALAGGRMIGMIQPRPGQWGAAPPPLYAVGCAGRITSFDETDDGRYLITLTGLCRFRVEQELEEQRGYRRVRPGWTGFSADMAEPTAAEIDRAGLNQALTDYFRIAGLSADWDAIGQTPDERLVTSLAMICPFEPQEKQALLEAKDLCERTKVMLSIIRMAIHGGHAGRVRH